VPDPSTDSNRAALRIAQWSIGAGVVLAATKLSAGYWGHSLAVLADGVESAGDVVSSSILWIGLQLAAQPADEDHPYGHGRYETLAGQAIGVFLMASGVLLAWQSWLRLAEQHSTPHPVTLWALLASILTKFLLARWKRKSAATLRSAALSADAMNDWLDVLSGLIALAAVALNVLDPQRFGHADSIGALLVALLVILLGGQVLYEASLQLIDTMPPPEQLAQIRSSALAAPGVRGVDKCRARRSGLAYLVDLHIEVDPQLTVEAGHRIGGIVRSQIRQQLPWVADVLVHIEPAPPR
jgi:cation diffusion facilitator family transporter